MAHMAHSLLYNVFTCVFSVHMIQQIYTININIISVLRGLSTLLLNI